MKTKKAKRFLKYSKEYIDSQCSSSGGYTKEILKSLGVRWPPVSGWRRRLEQGLDPNDPRAK